MKIVVIGAGPAGITAADTISRFDREAEIVLLSGEPYPPYSPPAVTEYLLTGQDVHLWKGRDFPAGLRIDYRAGARVTSISPEEKTVRLAGGARISYDRLVLASGARLFAPLEGQDKPGIYNLKSLSAIEEMKARIRSGQAKEAIVIGAGFIGVEIGLTLAEMGLQVKQLVRSRVLRSVLDEELSRLVERLMEQRGIRMLKGADSDAIGFAGEPRADGVIIKGGDILRADLIIAATGIRPNIEYLHGTGIEIRSGVVVDNRMRTNIPGISAAGDLAEVPDRVTGAVSIHGNFVNAAAQGRTAAYDILGWDIRYEGADTMNSLKHLGIPAVVCGHMDGREIRQQTGENIRKIYVRDNRITGFRLFGDIRSAGVYRTLMNLKTDVSPVINRLLEPGFGMGYLESIASLPALYP